jgi:hypothetical protein
MKLKEPVLLDVVASALTKEFQRRFRKEDYSTGATASIGRPKKMFCSLSRLQNSDGAVNNKAVSFITRQAVSALLRIKGSKRLRFYSGKGEEGSRAANVTSTPPAEISLYFNKTRIRDEIGFLFYIKSYK